MYIEPSDPEDKAAHLQDYSYVTYHEGMLYFGHYAWAADEKLPLADSNPSITMSLRQATTISKSEDECEDVIGDVFFLNRKYFPVTEKDKKRDWLNRDSDGYWTRTDVQDSRIPNDFKTKLLLLGITLKPFYPPELAE